MERTRVTRNLSLAHGEWSTCAAAGCTALQRVPTYCIGLGPHWEYPIPRSSSSSRFRLRDCHFRQKCG